MALQIPTEPPALHARATLDSEAQSAGTALHPAAPAPPRNARALTPTHPRMVPCQKRTVTTTAAGPPLVATTRSDSMARTRSLVTLRAQTWGGRHRTPLRSALVRWWTWGKLVAITY